MKKLILSAAACLLLCTGAFSAEKSFLKGKILKIDLKESIAERGGSAFSIGLGGINTISTLSLLGVERALQKAADDKDIAMVYLNLDHFSGSTAVVEEVRGYLKRFSAKGKPLDKNDYIIYDSKTGALFYDKDGKGKAAAIQFAQLKKNTKLTASDFFVLE